MRPSFLPFLPPTPPDRTFLHSKMPIAHLLFGFKLLIDFDFVEYLFHGSMLHS